MQAAQVIEAEQVNEIRQLIDELKAGTEQFKKQQRSIATTYAEIISSLDQTQEDYGETLKFFIQKLQKDMTPIQNVNGSLEDLLNTAALFGGLTTQTGKQVESLSQTIKDTEKDLATWSLSTKKDIKNAHKQAGEKVFRGMKFFILANTAGTIGIFITIFYFFYRTGIFKILNP